jgi:Leucine-rich repeat (LRR) protein
MPKLTSHKTTIILALALISGCNTYTLSLNNQPLYDPGNRLYTGEIKNADLQGCINFAIKQQNVKTSSELTILSCANSEISAVSDLTRLNQLRFLNLGNNKITDLKPLKQLRYLNGLNISNNSIKDIKPLLGLPSLITLNLIGNNEISCISIQKMTSKISRGLLKPERCIP